MHAIVETPNFSRQVDKVLDNEAYQELIDYLARNPLVGDEIPGTGGVRKMRIAASGRGKRGVESVWCISMGELAYRFIC